jgi:hypothetical protein
MAVCALILGAQQEAFRLPGLILLWLVVLSALASAFQYFRRFWSRVDGRVKEGRRLRLLERHAKKQEAPTTAQDAPTPL